MAVKNYICDLYNAEVIFISGVDHLKCKTILEKYFKADIEDWDHEESRGFCEVYEDPKRFVIYIKDKKDIETLIHEIVHLVDFIFQDRGIESNDSESRAYYTGYWYRVLTKGK